MRAMNFWALEIWPTIEKKSQGYQSFVSNSSGPEVKQLWMNSAPSLMSMDSWVSDLHYRNSKNTSVWVKLAIQEPREMEI